MQGEAEAGSLENKRSEVSLENEDSSDEAMDCHAAASAASRNDDKKAFFQNEDFNKNALNFTHAAKRRSRKCV